MASTAEQLSGQSEQLEEIVNFFKMKELAHNRGNNRQDARRKPQLALANSGNFGTIETEEGQYKTGTLRDDKDNQFEAF